MATALKDWLTPVPHDERRSVDVVRFAVAAILLTHAVHAALDPSDFAAFSRTLAERGLPAGLGVGLGGAAVVLQVAGSIALLLPRFVVVGALASLTVVAGTTLLHLPRWFVVGGFAVEGHPGIEFDALLLASLAGVAWTYWPRQGFEADAPGSAHGGFEIIRVASAISLLVHGLSPFVTWDIAGMHEWGVGMAEDGWPFGVALVWSIKGGEVLGCVGRLSRRLIVPACFGHLSYLIPGMWIAHRRHWFVEGAAENGIEFSVLIIVCTVACILAYWPARAARPVGSVASAQNANCTSGA
jgi:uncharacterized membrane protein YphA (DoxX/SURF4 family)